MISARILVKGVIQGVGFRPFIHRLAHTLSLQGFVTNTEEGALIEVTGPESAIENFITSIPLNSPRNAEITSLSKTVFPTTFFPGFSIKPTDSTGHLNTALTPDFQICKNCTAEIRDPQNRRYCYPFTTCVACGPRFSITKNFPFERKNTSLAPFLMCASCQREYDDQTDRRFHSQTNSCPACGPHLTLRIKNKTLEDQRNILSKITALLAGEKIGAIKTPSGYLLCCIARSGTAIARLRHEKHRPEKPLALLYPSLSHIRQDFEISSQEQETLCSSEGPIVILSQRKRNTFLAEHVIAPGLSQLGVMLPSSSLLFLIASAIREPLVATSGNISGSPIIAEISVAEEKLGSVVDFFVHDNIDIPFPQDDSVLAVSGKKKIFLRRSRGFAPNLIIKTQFKKQNILAMGADLKNTFALAIHDHIYMSPHFGDLIHYEVAKRYETIIEKMCTMFAMKPQCVLMDKHPYYQSCKIGKILIEKWNCKSSSIQHHKAHFASVLADNHLFDTREKILGVIWDGAGWGDDDHIWGGEFFIYNAYGMERVSHFQYYDWIAGDKMAREPRIALLALSSSTDYANISDKFTPTEWDVYLTLLQKNNLKTSSVGRLCDAAASALGFIDKTTYEGQAAMLLEQAARCYMQNSYTQSILPLADELDSVSIIYNLFRAMEAGESTEKIAARFLYTLSELIFREAEKHNITRIACSGGVFQNLLLIEMLERKCRISGYILYLNTKASPNDENISYGQLFYHEYLK